MIKSLALHNPIHRLLVQTLVVLAAASCCVIYLTPKAHAAALSDAQQQAILGIVAAFGATNNTETVVHASMAGGAVLGAETAKLTEAQINAILGLISSFGADSATIAKAEAALRGTAAPAAAVTSSANTQTAAFGASTVSTADLPIAALENIAQGSTVMMDGKVSMLVQLPESWLTSPQTHYLVFALENPLFSGFFTTVRVPGNSSVVAARIPLSLSDLADTNGYKVTPNEGQYSIYMYVFDTQPTVDGRPRVMRSDVAPYGALSSVSFTVVR